MTCRKNIIASAFCKFLLLTTLCATSPFALALPFGGELPPFENNTVLVLQHYAPSSMDMPIGGYLVPNSSMVAFRSNAQDNAVFFGALFGVAGVVALNTLESPSTEKTIDAASKFQVDLFPILEDQVKKQFSDVPVLMQDQDSSKNGMRLLVTPRGFLRINTDGITTVEIQVVAELLNEDGDTKWKSRYNYMPSTVNQLTGVNSWLEDQNARLRQVANDGITVGLQALAMDLKRLPYKNEIPLGQCRIGKGSLPWLGTLNGKAVVKEYINRPSGSFTHFFELSDCTPTN